jgi:outer membrane protein assembly factor BamA
MLGGVIGRALVIALGSLVIAAPAVADQLSDADLARKNEAGYVTAVPLFAYSDDFGLGVGARGYYYWNGGRSDPRFATTPYLVRTFLNVFATTDGLQFHWLDLDAPAILDSPYRLRAQLIFERNTNANYFGFSDAARGALHFPGSAATYSSYDAYTAAQHQVIDGNAYTKYDQYDLLRPAAIASIERSLLNNRVRVLGGIGFSYARIRDLTGTTVDATAADGSATTAPMATTRLRQDCDLGKLVGCGGGRDDVLRFAIAYDTRDFEPDPNRGIYADFAVDLGTAALGSQYDYARALLAVRGFYSPFPELADLVLAGRVLGQVESAGTPFFAMDLLPFIEDSRTGLGGHRTLRGFRQDRFVDHVMSAASAEIRWTFARTTIWHQQLAFIAVPFADLGHAFDSVAGVGLHDWKPSYGGAFRISWNLATLATFEYGRSSEGTGIYANFGHMF